MGTSSAFHGQGGNTPLVPSWLGTDESPLVDPVSPIPVDSPVPPTLPPIPQIGELNRFSIARNNFTRFAKSGGDDHRSLGRALSNYVDSASGGVRTAAARMGSSRNASRRLLSFLSVTTNRGVSEALKLLNFESLVGRPIEDIFLGLVDYICPDGGSVDEGIAREAFIETIVDLAGAGITNLDELTFDQMQIVFELYATNAIVARLCNDIGSKAVILPVDCRQAARVQAQLSDFIRRGVADSLTKARAAIVALTPDNVLSLVDLIYEQAFDILRTMGNFDEDKS